MSPTQQLLRTLRDDLERAYTAHKVGEPMEPTLLHQAIDTTDVGGSGCIPESVGMSWLLHRTDVLVDNPHIPDVQAFLAQHMDNHHVWLAIHSLVIMDLIDPTKRLAFVRDILLNHDVDNIGWVAIALEVGLSEWDIAQMTLDKLRQTEVDESSSVVDFVRHAFLRYGYGYASWTGNDQLVFVDEHTLWTVLANTNQLEEALRICAVKAPRSFFRGRHFGDPCLADVLRAYVPEGRLASIMNLALDGLTSLDDVSAIAFDVMPLTWQIRTLDSKGATPELVIHIALQLGYTPASRSFCAKHAEVFKTGPVQNHQQLRTRLSRREFANNGSAAMMAHHLLNQLVAAATNEEDGEFIYGIVVFGQHNNRTQWVVQHGGTKYVLSVYNRDYLPCEDDHVFVPRTGGVRLAKGQYPVIATDFQLAFRRPRP